MEGGLLTLKVGLIPLDERPVNVRYPRMIGAIAGFDVDLPPAEILSHFRQPADCIALADWLRKSAAQWDALIVSISMLAYGGLLPSRITDDPLLTVLERLEVLREIKRLQPQLRLYGFDLITRISKNAASVEEPDHRRESGPLIYRYSQQHDAHRWGDGPPPETADLNQTYLHDVLRRRARNHIVNLATLELLADDVFDLLVISSDDTSEYGFGTREKIWVKEWIDRRGGDERLLMYPGADEVAAALLARAIVVERGMQPRFFIHYAIEADAERIAPFEDGPVSLTVQRQISAVGGRQVDSAVEADLIVAVNPPAPSNQDFFNPAFAETDREYRAAALDDFAAQIERWIADGQQVIVCDVAYPNGSDPVLVQTLRRHIKLTDLTAYGGWNTAGNTIGVALAQGIACLRPVDKETAQQFLVHRFVEDHCYMHHVRPTLEATSPRYDDTTVAAMTAKVERGLKAEMARLPDLRGWRLRNVNLPWQRRFEVDFDLERL